MPSWVEAGTGVAITSGSATVSKAGCLAGSVIAVHILSKGLADDYNAFTNDTNVVGLGGGGTLMEDYRLIGPVGVVNYRQAVYFGRASSAGTCSVDITKGASDEDVFAMMHEFTGVVTENLLELVVENDATTHQSVGNTGSSVDDVAVVANGDNRLALNFVAIGSNRTIGEFDGETPAEWILATSFVSAAGTTGALGLQIAQLGSFGSIDGGSYSQINSAWGVIGTALIPFTYVAPQTPTVITPSVQYSHPARRRG